MSSPIAILGAGPGGLLLARILEINNIDYEVFDRDLDGSAQGGGGTLDIHAEDGQIALKEAGLFDRFKAHARYDGQACLFLDKDLDVIWSKPYIEGDEERPEIDRAVLRDILLESVPEEKIHWNHKVDKVEKADDGAVTITFANGSQRSGFRLVVGADGAWSKARSVITSATPSYSGRTYLQSNVTASSPDYPKIAAFAGTGMYTAMNGGASIIAQKMGTGAYNIYVSAKLPANWTKTNAPLVESPDFRQYLLDTYFADWHEQPRSLVAACNTPWHSWPLYSLAQDALPWAHVPGVTLIGDAAHLSVPNGEGVNIALFDAYQLAKGIIAAGPDGLDVAVREYEAGMFERGRASIAEGERFLEMFCADDAPRGFKAWIGEVTQEAAKSEQK